MNASSTGLTLVELLVALAITGLLLGLGAPGVGAWVAEQQLQERADALLHALDRARSEAVKRGGRVHVCPKASGACPGSVAPWEGGWTIAVPSAGGVAGTAVAVAHDRAAAPGITIRGNRPVADYVSYTSLGYARRTDGALQMGSFTVCRTGHKARRIVLANSGRARLERTTEACP